MSGRRQAAGDRAFAYNPWTRIGVFRHVCRYHAKAYYTTCWTSYTGDPPNAIGLSEVVEKYEGAFRMSLVISSIAFTVLMESFLFY